MKSYRSLFTFLGRAAAVIITLVALVFLSRVSVFSHGYAHAEPAGESHAVEPTNIEGGMP